MNRLKIIFSDTGRMLRKLAVVLAIVMTVMSVMAVNPVHAQQTVVVAANPADEPKWLATLLNWAKQFVNDIRRELQLAFGQIGNIMAHQLGATQINMGQDLQMAHESRVAETAGVAELVLRSFIPPTKSYCYPSFVVAQWHLINKLLLSFETAFQKATLHYAAGRGSALGQLDIVRIRNALDNAGFDNEALYYGGTVVGTRYYPYPTNFKVRGTGSNVMLNIDTGGGSSPSISQADAPADAALMYCLRDLVPTDPLPATQGSNGGGTPKDPNQAVYASQIGNLLAKSGRRIQSCLAEMAMRLQIGPSTPNLTSNLGQLMQAYQGMCFYLHGGQNNSSGRVYKVISDAQFQDCQTNGVSYLQLRQYMACRRSSVDAVRTMAADGTLPEEIDRRLMSPECENEEFAFEESQRQFNNGGDYGGPDGPTPFSLNRANR